MKRIPKTVWVLGLVSFFNDVASEMIYPIVPVFLTTVLRTSIPTIGFIEGTVEATASIMKYGFGTLSDYVEKRKPFVGFGYGLGAASKLLIGLATGWPLVLFARFVDRLGKGVRTAARDSILLENTTPVNRGFIFGFHRACDSLGAVCGPLIALVLLKVLHDNIRATFFIASIPATIGVLLVVLFIKEHKKLVSTVPVQKKFVRLRWKQLQPALKYFLVASCVFSLGNSADTFLLLNAQQLGLTTTLVIVVYVLFKVSQTLFATPAGQLADKIGAKRVFMLGLVVFALVYAGFGFTLHASWLWWLFPLYGVYMALTDGVSKAYISTFITTAESGTYFGLYYTLTAIASFFASIIAGLLWQNFFPGAAFYFGSIMAVLALAIFGISVLRSNRL